MTVMRKKLLLSGIDLGEGLHHLLNLSIVSVESRSHFHLGSLLLKAFSSQIIEQVL